MSEFVESTTIIIVVQNCNKYTSTWHGDAQLFRINGIFISSYKLSEDIVLPYIYRPAAHVVLNVL